MEGQTISSPANPILTTLGILSLLACESRFDVITRDVAVVECYNIDSGEKVKLNESSCPEGFSPSLEGNGGQNPVVDSATLLPVTDVQLSQASGENMRIAFSPAKSGAALSYNAKLCPAKDCSTSCGSAVNVQASPAELTLPDQSGVELYACVQSRGPDETTSDWAITPVAFVIDRSAPAGSISLAGGAAISTSKNPAVSLNYDADAHQYQLCASAQAPGTSCPTADLLRSWEAVSTTPAAHTFSQDGDQSLHVQFRDTSGNISGTFATSITIDSVAPSLPSTLAFGGTWSANTGQISFTAASDATSVLSYEIKACTDAACSAGCVEADQMATTSPVSLSGLVENTIYYACVQAVDAAGNVSGFAASALTTTIDATAPTAPTAVSTSTNNTGPISISFTPGTDANPDDFSVRACTNINCEDGCDASTSSASSPAILSTGLQSETDYYVCVQGQDEAGNTTSWIPSATTTHYDTTIPTGTIALSNTAGFAATRTPVITLTADADVQFYKLCNTAKTAGNECTGGEEVRSFSAYSSTPAVYDFGSDGPHTLYVQFQDDAGNISATFDASITIDTILPAAPTGLGLSDDFVSSDSIDVSFSPGADTNYETSLVSACENASCNLNCVGATTSAISPVTLTGLTPNTTYYGCVSTRDDAGNLSATVATATTVAYDDTEPTAPTGAAWPAAYANTTTLSLSFTNGSDNLSFDTHELRACRNNDCETNCDAAATTASSPQNLTGLTAGQSYYGCARSRDDAGRLSSWAISSATTIDQVDPVSPASVSWDSVYDNDTTEGISYAAGSDGVSFATHEIKACTNAACSTSCVFAPDSAGTTASISGLSAGTPYYACVRAVDAAGNTDAFTASASTHTIDQVLPIAPSGPSVGGTHFSSSTVTLSFTDGSDVVDFATHRIKACPTNACSGACEGETTAATTSGDLVGLTAGSSFYGCVRSEDSAGNNSAWVATAASFVVDTSDPVAGNSGTLSNSSVSYSSMDINWTAATDTVTSQANLEYRLFYSTSSTMDDLSDIEAATAANSFTANITTLSVTGLTHSTTYYFNLVVRDESGRKVAYSKLTAATAADANPPSDPANVSDGSSTLFATTTPTITWDASSDGESGLSHYDVAIKRSSDDAVISAFSSVGNVLSSQITGLTLVDGTSYYAEVRAVDVAGNSSSAIAGDGFTYGLGTATSLGGSRWTNGVENAVNSEGKMAVAGSDADSVFLSYFDGSTWSLTNSQVVNYNEMYDHDIAMDGEGDVWVAINIRTANSTSGWGHIRVGTYDASTDTYNGDTLLSTSNYVCRTPRIAMNESGQGVIAWVEGVGADQRVKVREYDSGTWAAEVDLMSSLSGFDVNEERLEVVINENGLMAVSAAIDDADSVYDSYVWVKSIGTGSWTSASISEAGGGIDLDINDNDEIAWSATGGDAGDKFFAKVYSGGSWGATASYACQADLSINANYDFEYSSVSINASGNAMAISSCFRGSTNQQRIGVATYDGSSWSISATWTGSDSSGVFNEDIELFDDGTAVATWGQYNSAPFFMHRFDGSSWDTAVDITNSNSLVDKMDSDYLLFHGTAGLIISNEPDGGYVYVIGR